MRRILIIDDEEGVRETLGIFSEMLGYTAILAEDTASCSTFHLDKQECSQESACADILLIDQHLPTMTGLEFIKLQSVKGCKAAAHCKAIMSGFLSDKEFSQAKKLGCYVLQKPITYEILESWLSSVDEKKKQLQEADS